jgi:prepilin-type N-terminal cleavage/methylation domain-containing protein
MKRTGFTLIEILVVIAIIASIIAIAIPNYLSARQRASDVKKKEEMASIKTALRLYYNDYNNYPGGTTGMVMNGCGVGGTGACPCSDTVGFATGATCDYVYMKKFPAGFLASPNTYLYYQTSGGDDFCLRAVLDNLSDPDIAISQSRCASACGANCSTTGRYCVCAD